MEAPEPVAQPGAPVEYAWNIASCTTLAEDAERYEKEFNELFDSDNSDWESVPLKNGKLWLRPLTQISQPGPVSKWEMDLDSPAKDAKALFKYLMTLDGFKVIDPDSDLSKTRSNPCQTFTYKGIEGYTCACVSNFESLGMPPMVCPNAVWYDDNILLNWMCPIPKDLRPTESQDVETDYHMTYALKCTDVSPGVVRVHQLMWVDFLKGPLGKAGQLGHCEAFGTRLKEYLAKEAEA